MAALRITRRYTIKVFVFLLCGVIMISTCSHISTNHHLVESLSASSPRRCKPGFCSLPSFRSFHSTHGPHRNNNPLPSTEISAQFTKPSQMFCKPLSVGLFVCLGAGQKHVEKLCFSHPQPQLLRRQQVGSMCRFGGRFSGENARNQQICVNRKLMTARHTESANIWRTFSPGWAYCVPWCQEGIKQTLSDSNEWENVWQKIERLKKTLRTCSKARDVREAIATITAFSEKGDVEMDGSMRLLMMQACRSTGEWRRCLSLHRRNLNTYHECVSRSIAMGACARWEGDSEAWELLTETEKSGYFVSPSAACRLWMLANSHHKQLPKGKGKIKGKAKAMAMSSRQVCGSMTLRAVRATKQKTARISAEELRLKTARLVTMTLPPNVLKKLLGHPGPASEISGHGSDREAKHRLQKAQSHTALSRGALPSIVAMMEEVERCGLLDLHGYSALDAMLGVEIIIDLLQHNHTVNSVPSCSGKKKFSARSSLDKGIDGEFAVKSEKLAPPFAESGMESTKACAEKSAESKELQTQVGELSGSGVTDQALDFWGVGCDALSLSDFVIVTGQGLHSDGGKAVIKPAVEALLESLDIRFQTLEGNGGALRCMPTHSMEPAINA